MDKIYYFTISAEHKRGQHLATETRGAIEQAFLFAAEINATPTKRLGYRTPEKPSETELDCIYAAT